MQSIIRIFGLLMVCCAFSGIAQAQTPYLEKSVTIRSGNYTYEELFRQLSAQTGVVFSYTGFDDKKRVTAKYDKEPLRIVLNNVFDEGNCTYKLKGKYIIITCKPAPKAKPETDNSVASNSNVIVNGYIYNAEDSTQVPESSVYLRQNKQSAVTDEYGYFNMSFPKTADVLSISIAKEDFEDTTIVILSRQRNTVVIYLQPKSPPVSIMVNDSLKLTIQSDTVLENDLPSEETEVYESPFWKHFEEQRANLRNISDTLFNTVSFSFVPPLSTNHLLAINTVNKYSFNALVGYSHGIDVFEFGGLVNLDYGNVKYCQIAGLANLVSGTTTGVQVAGIVNTVGRTVDGIQVGGIANLVQDTVRAVQVSGITNLNNSFTEGVQVAGIFNRSRNMFGSQIAGIANTADTVNGIQIAGLVNNAGFVFGSQVSGLLNRAQYVNGSQLGFINVAHGTSGVPVGFLSIVTTGYHKLELAGDENAIGTLSFRTGVDALHNIFFAGMQVSDHPSLWTYGYGMGSAIRLGRKCYLDLDVTAQHLDISNDHWNYNLFAKGFVGIEYRFTEKFGIAAGPTINWYNAESYGTVVDPIWSRIEQHTLYSSDNGSFANQLWVGGKVAIRFF